MGEERGAGRIGWVDLFRGAMMFFIVLAHSLNIEGHPLRNYLCSFHVAAFFCISGYCFSGRERFHRFLLRRVKTLLLPYACFALVSIAVYMVLGGRAASALEADAEAHGLGANLLGMLYGNGKTGLMKWNLPLWFIPCFFLAQVMLYAAARLCQGAQGLVKWRAALVFTLFTALAAGNYYGPRLKELPFGLETAVYLMPFMLAGFFLRRAGADAARAKAKPAIALALLAGGGALAFRNPVLFDYVSDSYGILPLFYTAAAMSIAGWALLCACVRLPWGEYVGRNTFPVLLMHKFPIVFLQMFLQPALQGGVLVSAAAGLGIAAAALAASLAAGLVLGRLCPWLIGR